LRRIINGEDGSTPIIVYLLVLLLLPLFLYEGYLLQQTATQIEVEDVSVEEYTTEILDGEATKIEMDINIDVRNHAPRNIKIERLEYDLMIEPEDFELEDIELDSGELYNEIIYGGGVTTISIPIENEDEEDIETIQDYILEEEGEVEAVTEIHVPLLQLVVDLPITTVSEQLVETFEYEPVLADYEVDEEESSFERADEEVDADYFLNTPYEIESNENEFLSGNIAIETTMTDDKNITSTDYSMLKIGDIEKGNLTFRFSEDEIEEMMTERQTITFTSDLNFEDDISFQRELDTVVSEPMLVEYELDVNKAELNETEKHLEVPYNIETQETAFFEEGGMMFVTTEMESEDESIDSETYFEIEIGEVEKGKLEFELDDDEVEELRTDDKTLQFISDVERDDVSFEYDHDETVEWEAPEDELPGEENDENEVSDIWKDEETNELSTKIEEERTRDGFYVSSESKMIELGV